MKPVFPGVCGLKDMSCEAAQPHEGPLALSPAPKGPPGRGCDYSPTEENLGLREEPILSAGPSLGQDSLISRDQWCQVCSLPKMPVFLPFPCSFCAVVRWMHGRKMTCLWVYHTAARSGTWTQLSTIWWVFKRSSFR